MAEVHLAQEEIWDDSDLLESWNAAFAEYKKYHSLAAKGQKVTVEPEAPKIEEVKTPARATTSRAVTDIAMDDEQEGSEEHGPAQDFAPSAAKPTVPEALGASVQDETMRNMMMSWYYAGYYTGLLEGKQQGYASAVQVQQAQQPSQQTG